MKRNVKILSETKHLKFKFYLRSFIETLPLISNLVNIKSVTLVRNRCKNIIKYDISLQK